MIAASMRTTSLSSGTEGAIQGVLRRLIVVHGATVSGQSVIVLDDTPVIVGRDAAVSNLVLDDHRVSRRHARIARDPASGATTVADLESRNGVLVDGVHRDCAELRDGSVIRVGKSLLLFSEEDAAGIAQIRDEAAPLFGPSLAMGRVRGEIERVARTALPVLVLGETGVGKELAAHAIHAASGRKGAFVPVNCAAIPESVAEAELFGHEAGAFTGAAGRREGLFAAAEGGTLFLDEIGELPLALQPKLLRALALGEIRPVGSTRPRRVDVRIVAATLRDLEAAEREGTFRSDLLARLSGFPLRIPPLRARREDILALAARFLRDKPGAPELSVEAAEALILHPFPQNVRELEHQLGFALLRWPGEGPIGTAHLSLRARSIPADSTPPPRLALSPGARPPREDLLATLARCRGNVARVAAHYGRDRHQVYRWIEHYELDVARFREP
jgi:transcriptional regulator with GAF, ATPase, and Fis domain